MTKIKICGIKNVKEAEYLNKAKVDYAGLVFHGQSKRNVTVDEAKEIIKALDAGIKKVAVTVSPDTDTVKELANLGFDILQVHDELSKEVIRTSTIPIWYACNISDKNRLSEMLVFRDLLSEEEKSKITGIVMDAPEYGSGKTFDWNAESVSGFGSESLELILAGGLNAENVEEGIELFNPDIVDVSTGVEGEDGKDEEKIMRFVEIVRNVR